MFYCIPSHFIHSFIVVERFTYRIQVYTFKTKAATSGWVFTTTFVRLNQSGAHMTLTAVTDRGSLLVLNPTPSSYFLIYLTYFRSPPGVPPVDLAQTCICTLRCVKRDIPGLLRGASWPSGGRSVRHRASSNGGGVRYHDDDRNHSTAAHSRSRQWC